MEIVVWGFYNKKNSGDQFFIEAFKNLFPEHIFTFTDTLTVELINRSSAIFIGGGSLLLDKPNFSTEVLSLLQTKKILYISIGTETSIHPIHIELMWLAKLICTRTKNNLEKVLQLNSNSIYAPDIVYSLKPNNEYKKILKSILICNNAIVVPAWYEDYWKHASWNYFKSEFSQFLDYLVEQKYNVNFFPFSNDLKSNDRYASIEIINSMKYKDQVKIIANDNESFNSITKILSQYNIVITQRFHGIVLSEICNLPYLTIHHHDKLKKTNNERGSFISYYQVSKQALIDNFENIKDLTFEDNFVDETAFDELKIRVDKILKDEQ